jgi:hypothetical protein
VRRRSSPSSYTATTSRHPCLSGSHSPLALASPSPTSSAIPMPAASRAVLHRAPTSRGERAAGGAGLADGLRAGGLRRRRLPSPPRLMVGGNGRGTSPFGSKRVLLTGASTNALAVRVRATSIRINEVARKSEG